MSEENKNTPNPNQNKLNIELPDNIAEGIYSNLAIVSHSNTEFIFDYIRLLPGVRKARVKSRIVMSPVHAKRLMRVLVGNIKKYEAENGAIKDLDQQQNVPPINFGGPPPGEA